MIDKNNIKINYYKIEIIPNMKMYTVPYLSSLDT